jgi:hypothetical protein
MNVTFISFFGDGCRSHHFRPVLSLLGAGLTRIIRGRVLAASARRC